MTIFSDVLLVAGALTIWGLFVVVIPSTMRWRLRSQLWTVNRALLADYEQGHFRDHPEEVQRLFRELQIARRCAHELTPAKLGAFLVVTWGTRRPAPRPVDLSVFTDREERRRMEKHVDTFHGALKRHFMLGAPSGWALTIVVLVVFVVAVLVAAAVTPLLHLFKRTTFGFRSLPNFVFESVEESATEYQVGALQELYRKSAHGQFPVPAGA